MRLIFVFPLVLNQIVAVSIDSNTIFFLSDDSKTVVGYDGALHCEPFRHFCAWLVYIEIDAVGDDMVKKVPTQCTDTGVLYHNAAVVFKGGDGPGDYYEPGVQIFHDCTKNKFIWQMTSPLPTVSMRNRFIMTQYSINLTVTSYPDYHRGAIVTNSFHWVSKKTHPNLFKDDSRRFTKEELEDYKDRFP
ncbi:hypothetical protein B9Z55_025552 [Caenorhabditis nigoni]|uniref:Uncharacterized protein n=1 Tax=Caenorhabditis nigoni TaxID=1611254 RepID=A0A2G5SZM5_9PELO|nr:hypothetical protein B9Z55_025552 [Caenorhabditis nigoni]